jgi:hypothetical protein
VKAIVGLVMGLRFVHSFGLQHGNLTMNNIHLREDGLITISDFFMKSIEDEASDESCTEYVESFSGKCWRPTADVCAFAKILLEIVVVRSSDECELTPILPSFVFTLIEECQSAESTSRISFADIFDILKQNDFNIVEGVDVKKVSDFVDWIERCERLIE